MSESTATDVIEVEAISLFTEKDDEEQVDSVVPLRWCLSPPARKELAKQEVARPYTLLVTEQDGVELGRQVVPTMDLMCYTQFRRPAANLIHGGIVWEKEGVDPRKHFLRKNPDGSFKVTALRERRIRVEELTPQLETLKTRRETVRGEINVAHLSLMSLKALARERPQNAVGLHARVTTLISELSRVRGEVPVLEDSGFLVDEVDTSLSDLRDTLATELAPAEKKPEPTEEMVTLMEQIARLEEERDRLTPEIDQLATALAEAEAAPPDEHVLADFEEVNHLHAEGQLAVIVKPEMFGHSWPITKRLGTLYHFWDRPARDQCNMRERAIITAASLPFFALGGLALMLLDLVIMALLLVAGKRDINFAPIRRPYLEKPNAIWSDLKPSVWVNKQRPRAEGHPGYFYEERSPAFTLVNPPVMLGLAAVLLAVNQIFGFGTGSNAVVSGVSVWQLVLFGLLAPVAITLVVAVAWYLRGFLRRANDVVLGPLERRFFHGTAKSLKEKREREAKLSKQRQREAAKADARKRQKLAEAAAKDAQRAALERNLQQLACSSATAEMRLAALPPERRTVRLRWAASKARVCRPFPS